MFEGAPFIDAGHDFEGRGGAGVFEIAAIHNVSPIGKTASRAHIRETRAHMSSSAERNVAGDFCRSLVRRAEFHRGVFYIEKTVGDAQIAGHDALAFFDGRSVEKKRGHPLLRIIRPKIDKRARETIIPHSVAPGFFPSAFQCLSAIEISNRNGQKTLH